MTGNARKIEALLFLSPEPLSLQVLAELIDADRSETQAALAEVEARHGVYSGLEVAHVAGGVALRTRPDLEEVCDRLRERPPEDRLSPAAMETLAVVAYLEPVTRPDISRLRGVAVDSTVANLVDRGLLEEAGRTTTGAVRYRTTRAFQQRFGLHDSGDLPPIERFELTGPQADELRARLVDSGHLDPESSATLREVPPVDAEAGHDDVSAPAGTPDENAEALPPAGTPGPDDEDDGE